MKKVILVAAVAMLALASCKKDHTCSCTVTSSGGLFGDFSVTADTVYTDMKKGDAEDLCVAQNASATVAGSTTTVACELK